MITSELGSPATENCRRAPGKQLEPNTLIALDENTRDDVCTSVRHDIVVAITVECEFFCAVKNLIDSARLVSGRGPEGQIRCAF
jgi:hypothetical protein